MNGRTLSIKFSIILFIAILFSGNIFPQTIALKNKFAFGIVNELLRTRKYQNTFNLNNYNALNPDVQQSYSNRGDNDNPWEQCFGGFKDDINNYSTAVNTSINYTDALKVFERAKIVRGAYGQRSTYQAEEMDGMPFPQYYYSSHETGRDCNDQNYGNIRVRKCIVNEDDANKYIVKNLIENCEQVNRPAIADDKTWDIEYMISDNKSVSWKWYVKPRMRIPMSIVNDNSKQDDVVVSIEVINFNNSDVRTFDIKVKYFKNYPYYNGEYIELYYFNSTQLFDLSVPSSFLCTGVTEKNNSTSQVDYRIKWPGLVDVYLDYVRVDDEWAHYLFNPDLDLQNPTPYLFIDKIQQETSTFGFPNDLLSYYYMDECPINSFPCIAEVNRIIKQQPGNHNKGLFAIMMKETAMDDYGLLKNKPKDKDEYINYILSFPDLITDVFLYTCYPFHNQFKYPSNLNASGMGEGIEYAHAVSPADYNNSMMNNFQLYFTITVC